VARERASPRFLEGQVVELDIREKRRGMRRTEARRRWLVAAVLVLLVHLVGAPVLLLSIPMSTPRLGEPEVALVRVPASQWDSARAGASHETPTVHPAPTTPPPPAEEPPKPEEKPAQVVETAPGNDQKPDDDHLAAETNNRTDHPTISRDRHAGQKVTMPKASTATRPSESTKPAPAQPLAIGGDESNPSRLPSEVQPHLEFPHVQQRDRLALKLDPHLGEFQNREQSDALNGNSDHLRVSKGDGTSEAPGGGGAPGAHELTTLSPSAGVLDRITGGPAPDHVDDVDEGDATFLNTREWRFASFFNRVKSTVAAQWDPNDVIRRRDPSGAMFLWKDRYTLLTIRLRPDGRLADVWIERSSGVDFLDEEAVAAFQKAQPFPNPPRGLADASGEIRFSFGFYLETSSASFRIFRR
jgi:TonB family protein